MTNNKETKCNGYEAMFTFLSDEDFTQHINDCEACAKEHAKMQKISELINEAKPYIKEKQRQKVLYKKVAAFFVIAFASLSFPLYMAGVNTYDNLVAINSLSVEEMGLPVDEYGFLYVE